MLYVLSLLYIPFGHRPHGHCRRRRSKLPLPGHYTADCGARALMDVHVAKTGSERDDERPRKKELITGEGQTMLLALNDDEHAMVSSAHIDAPTVHKVQLQLYTIYSLPCFLAVCVLAYRL